MNVELKVAIVESGRSQRQIAAAVPMPETRLSDIVRRWRQPTEAERARIAEVLGKPESQLFGEKPGA